MLELSSRLVAVLAASSLLLAACGDDGNDASGPAAAGTPEDPRAIEVSMVDIGYEPNALTVSAGETVRFLFTNTGKIRHEAVLGDEATQEEHEVEMQEMGGMAMDDEEMGETADHDEEAPSISLEPGSTGEMLVTFDAAGATILGCHEPSHWAAGMRLDITIEA